MILVLLSSNLVYALPPTCTDSTWLEIYALPTTIQVGYFTIRDFPGIITYICEPFDGNTIPSIKAWLLYKNVTTIGGNDPDQVLEYHRKPD